MRYFQKKEKICHKGKKIVKNDIEVKIKDENQEKSPE